MKKLLALCVILCFFSAQVKAEIVTFPMGIYISNDVSTMPKEAQDILSQRLKNALSMNGIAAYNQAPTFIQCTTTLLDREVIGSVPAKIIQKVEFTLSAIDATSNRIFQTTTFTLKGVGINETKAYMSAMEELHPSNRNVKTFLSESCQKIVAYYDSKIDLLIKTAKNLAIGGKFEEALYTLAVIPSSCQKYSLVESTGVEIYGMYIEDELFKKLQQAKRAWASKRNYEAADEALNIIADIPQSSPLRKQADELYNEIKKQIKDERLWEKERVTVQEGIQKQQVDAWRQVGVAYGEHQQPVNYRSLM
ncbi:MAG: hypothetical protein KBT27_11135 [Prevotellaceae bacterium]|nr:hypothetical protein [Candidatus Faecinaster equi]